jgi:hypothetical protein
VVERHARGQAARPRCCNRYANRARWLGSGARVTTRRGGRPDRATCCLEEVAHLACCNSLASARGSVNRSGGKGMARQRQAGAGRAVVVRVARTEQDPAGCRDQLARHRDHR